MGLKGKDLLGVRELSVEEIRLILDTAASMKEIASRDIKKVPALRGKTVINLFYEPSTRTRTSFEIAGKWLSADVINISTSASSVVKGESLKDTGLTLQSMHPDVVVIRHAVPGAPHLLARLLKASVINAGDGAHEHPTQALCGPPTLLPRYVETLGVEKFLRIEQAIADADVIMMLRIQRERMGAGLFPTLREYSKLFGLNVDRLKAARPDVLIMHPGPINRGVEIAPEVADGPYSMILDQVENGLAIRMALLYLLAGGQAANN